MAASRSEPPAAADQLMEPSKEEMCFPAENKELIVTMTVEELDVQSNNAATDTREEEEATPTPPESSSLSSENGTVTVATTEEESLSVMLKHIKTDRWPEREGEPGKGRGQGQLFPENHFVSL